MSVRLFEPPCLENRLGNEVIDRVEAALGRPLLGHPIDHD